MLRWVTYLSNRVFFTSSSKFYLRRFFACFKHLRYTLHHHSLFLDRQWVFVVVFLVRPRTWYLTRTSPAGFLLSNIIPGLTFSEKDRHPFIWDERIRRFAKHRILLRRASNIMSRSRLQLPRSPDGTPGTMTPFSQARKVSIFFNCAFLHGSPRNYLQQLVSKMKYGMIF